MSFKAWARANAPKAYKPPKQPPKNTGPVLSVEAAHTAEFQPGDYIHYTNSVEQIRYGRFVRYDGGDIYAHFGNTPQESERSTFATHTRHTNVRPGWPTRPTAPIIRQPVNEPVALADEFDEWDEF